MRIEKTKFFSKKIGNLPKGCRQCVKGQKLVFFVTGICPRRCYYCPISDKKYQHDVIYANERPVKNIHQILLTRFSSKEVMKLKGLLKVVLFVG